MAQITIIDRNDLFGKMQFLKGFPRSLKEPTVASTKLLKERMQFYPPPPPNSSYIRTGNLGRSWKRRTILNSRTLGKVFSDHPDYNKFVQGGSTQAGIHRGRWQTDDSVASESENEILTIYDDFIQSRLID